MRTHGAQDLTSCPACVLVAVRPLKGEGAQKGRRFAVAPGSVGEMTERGAHVACARQNGGGVAAERVPGRDHDTEKPVLGNAVMALLCIAILVFGSYGLGFDASAFIYGGTFN